MPTRLHSARGRRRPDGRSCRCRRPARRPTAGSRPPLLMAPATRFCGAAGTSAGGSMSSISCGERVVEVRDVLRDEARHLDGAVLLEVRVVDGSRGALREDARIDVQEHGLRGLRPDLVEVGAARRREVDEQHVLLDGELGHLRDVLGEAHVEQPGRGVEAAPRDGRHEDRRAHRAGARPRRRRAGTPCSPPGSRSGRRRPGSRRCGRTARTGSRPGGCARSTSSRRPWVMKFFELTAADGVVGERDVVGEERSIIWPQPACGA